MSNLTDIADQALATGIDTTKQQESDFELLNELVAIYDVKSVSETLKKVSPKEWGRESISKIVKGKLPMPLFNTVELDLIQSVLPQKPEHFSNPDFTFVDLFAGIGGIRAGFEAVGGKCLFTSEWNKYSQKTYRANWFLDEGHIFNSDIREITLSNQTIDEQDAYKNIDKEIPDHDVLLAGFPCQPFSLAGVSKKNSLGRSHGFECEAQGTLFFDVARILKAKQPSFFLLENVKNLKSHDKGNTFKIILKTLDELGYDVAHAEDFSSKDPKIIDAKNFVPQHRERIVLVGFKRGINHSSFSLHDIKIPSQKDRPKLKDILDENVESKYILTPKLWEYLYNYSKKHKAKGNGFGYGLFDPNDIDSVVRTLSARYHKDGSEILINDRGWDKEIAELNFHDQINLEKRPRRLTPRECARLMGFDRPRSHKFKIPVSDTQAYKQFGNSVVVPVFQAIAELMKPIILENR
jgi:DNA (cytosine-5)-methyltransferase 1